MTSVSGTAAGPSFLSQGEGPPSPLHQSVEDLANWFSSEIHSFLSTNSVCAPIAFPTQAADTNYHQGHPEGITTFATAIIPFSGRVVPTTVILSLVPSHLGAGQYSPPLDQRGEHSPFTPSHLSEPPQPPIDYPMAAGDTTIDPRYLECAEPSPGGFPTDPINTVPQAQVHHDHQVSGYGDTTQELMPDGIPAAVTSPNVAVYPPSFDQIPSACSGHYLVPAHSSSSSSVHSGVFAHPAHQSGVNGLSTSRQLLGQTYQDMPTLSTTARPIRGARVDRHPSHYQCTMCDAEYPSISARNRHCKDVHLPLISCDFCGLGFSSGRRYLLTQHLEADHPNA